MREQNYNFTKNFRSYIMIVIIPFIIVGFLTIEILFGSLANDTKRLNYDKIEQCASNLDNEINKMHAIFSKEIFPKELFTTILTIPKNVFK